MTVTDNDGATATATETIVVDPGTGVGTARVQFIHAAPFETARVEVDGVDYGVYAYWTASPYVDVLAGTPINIEVIPVNPFSTASPASFNVTLTPDETYVITLHGTFDDADNIPVEAAVFAGSRETVSANEVGLLMVHASPDQQEVDVVSGGNVLFDDVEYGTYNDTYTVVPASNYVIDLTPAADNSSVLHRYALDLDFWKSRTAVVFATGFESNGTFQSWVALSTGGTYPLPELATSSSRESQETALLMPQGTEEAFYILPNPVRDLLQTYVRLDQKTQLDLTLYNANGQKVLNVFSGKQDQGVHQFESSLSHLASGTYYIQMITDYGQEVKTVIVIR